MQKVSLIAEECMCAVVFLVGIALALMTLGIDDDPLPPQHVYSTSFLKFPRTTTPSLRYPLDCDATVTQASPGELPRRRCYVRSSKRKGK